MLRRTALARLYEELRNIEVFDRIHDYGTDADVASEQVYAIRQMRRKQILDEITRLKASKSEQRNAARVSSAVAFVCAVGFAMLYVLLK